MCIRDSLICCVKQTYTSVVTWVRSITFLVKINYFRFAPFLWNHISLSAHVIKMYVGGVSDTLCPYILIIQSLVHLFLVISGFLIFLMPPAVSP